MGGYRKLSRAAARMLKKDASLNCLVKMLYHDWRRTRKRETFDIANVQLASCQEL